MLMRRRGTDVLADKTIPTRYRVASCRDAFTGQYSHMDDSATDLGAAGFGLMFYNARWYDPLTGRFAQADTVMPGGVQGLDRYAYTFNNPLRYVDPSGHLSQDQIMEMLGVSTWEEVLALFGDGGKYEGLWGMLELFRNAEVGDHIYGCYGRSHVSSVTCYYVGDIAQGENGLTLLNPNEENKQVDLEEIKNRGFAGFLWGRGGIAPSKLLLTNEFLSQATFAGNSLYEIDSHDHLGIDPDVSPFTLFMDGVGILGSFFGLGWVSKSVTVTKTGKSLSMTSSFYGGLNSAKESDVVGGALSGASFAPGIYGLVFSVGAFLNDLLNYGP